MTDLFKDGFHFEWINVFVFAGQKHRSYSGNMEVTHLESFGAILEVSVHYTYCKEKGEVVALKVGKDFNHPIDHSSSEVDVDIMCIKSIRCIKFKFKFSQVFVNIRTQLIPDVDVLSLNFGGGFS